MLDTKHYAVYNKLEINLPDVLHYIFPSTVLIALHFTLPACFTICSQLHSTSHSQDPYNVNRSATHVQTFHKLRSTLPAHRSTARFFQTALEHCTVLSDSARSFADSTGHTGRNRCVFRMLQYSLLKIAKYGSSCVLSVGLWETSRECKTIAQLCRTSCAILSQ